MWSDKENSADYLNFSEVSDIASDLISQPNLLPISIGVYGSWGAGKSTVLNLLKDDLHSKNVPTIVVDFDAWLYQDFDDARAALMDVITDAISEEVKDNEGLLDKVKELSRKVNYFRVAGMLADASLFAATGTPPGILTKLMGAGKDLLSGEGDKEDIADLKSAATEGKKTLGGVLNEQEDNNSPAREITEFRREFGQLLESIDKTLVVFIDNIDRCLPKKAIQTLEAVRQFLFLPSTAFVIAADEEMVRHAVREHYSDPSERLISDYLDKMVQVAIKVPRVGVQELQAYMTLLYAEASGLSEDKLTSLREQLIETLQQVWKGTPVTKKLSIEFAGLEPSDPLAVDFELAERLAPILAHTNKINGNPRIVKRLMTSIRMRNQIAQRRGMPIDEALIAKMAVLERCVSEKSYQEVCAIVNSSTEGKVEFLSDIEEAISTGESIEDKLPPLLKDEREFIQSWAEIEPKLSGYDLRSAIYLSRDIAPIRIADTSVSELQEQAFLALVEFSKLAPSPAVKQILEDLSSEEAMTVMELLIKELRKISDWTRQVKGFGGAFLLADKFPDTRGLLSQFVNGLGLKETPKWLALVVNKRDWLN